MELSVPRRHRPTAAATALLAAALLLTACGEDASAPAPGEADTGVPLNVGSEEPVATSSESVAP